MSDIPAGFWPCKVVDGFFGDSEKGIPMVRINVEVTEGPGKGTRQTYEEAVNNKQAPYIARTCKAVGWKGPSMRTLKADIEAWIKATGGASTVEIKHLEVRKGNKFEKWCEGGCEGPAPIWVKPSSIGRGPKPLTASSERNLADVDEVMRAALAADAAGSAGYDDAPPSGGYSGGHDDDAPPSADNDIPFITNSLRYDRVRLW